MLTFLPPVIAEIKGMSAIGGAPIMDAFERVGEPIAVRYMCEGGVKALFGKLPPYLVPTPVEITGCYITNPLHETVTGSN